MKRLKIFCYTLAVCSLLFNVVAFAHAGKTDSNGGHTDHSSGDYHYHHGYSAHDHYDMDGDGIKDCPYNFDDKTNHNSGGSVNGDGSGSANKPNKDANEDKNIPWGTIALISSSIIIFVMASFVLFSLLKYPHYSKQSIVNIFIKKSNAIINTPFNIKVESEIQQNYLYVDHIVETKQKLDDHLDKAEKSYKEKTSRISRFVNICVWVSAITFTIFLLTVLCSFLDSELWMLWLSVSTIFTLFIFLWIDLRLFSFQEKNDHLFLDKIKSHTQKNVHLLYSDLVEKATDLYQFLGIPSNIPLNEQSPPGESSIRSRSYGPLTRYITPSGNCFHKKRGCSSSFLPVNVYELIYKKQHFKPCSKCCSAEDCNIVLPQWYIYYIKTTGIINEFRTIENNNLHTQENA